MLKRSDFLKLFKVQLCCCMSMLRKMNKMIVCGMLIFSSLTIYSNNGKSKPTSKSVYTMHIVKFGETLNKIAKKYNVSIDEILQVNPSLTANSINPEQIIRIPKKNINATTSSLSTKNIQNNKVKDEVDAVKLNKKTHEVQQGQTLYSISKMYGVTVDELRKWNDLSDNNIKIGSLLIVGNETAQPIKSKPEIQTPAKKVTQPTPEPIVAKEQLASDETENTEADTEKPDIQASDNANQKELSLIYKQQTTNKQLSAVKGTGAPMTTTLGAMESVYFAMHKTLPIGTVLKIKNLVNSKIVYAKVIGKLPDTDENKHVIVRYSLGVKKDLQLQNGKCYVQIEFPQ